MRRGRALGAGSGVTVRIVPRFGRAFQGAKRLHHGVFNVVPDVLVSSMDVALPSGAISSRMKIMHAIDY